MVGDIYSFGGITNIMYSLFYDNKDTNNYICIHNFTGKITANYNWFGQMKLIKIYYWFKR